MTNTPIDTSCFTEDCENPHARGILTNMGVAYLCEECTDTYMNGL